MEGGSTITMEDTTIIITGESAIGGEPTTDMGMQSVYHSILLLPVYNNRHVFVPGA